MFYIYHTYIYIYYIHIYLYIYIYIYIWETWYLDFIFNPKTRGPLVLLSSAPGTSSSVRSHPYDSAGWFETSSNLVGHEHANLKSYLASNLSYSFFWWIWIISKVMLCIHHMEMVDFINVFLLKIVCGPVFNFPASRWWWMPASFYRCEPPFAHGLEDPHAFCSGYLVLKIWGLAVCSR